MNLISEYSHSQTRQGGGERAWYPLFVHVSNCHEIPWLHATFVF